MEYQNTEIMQCCYENQEQQNSSCIHHSHLIYFPEDCFYLSDTLLEPSLSYNNTMTLGHTMPIDYTTTNLHSQTVCNNKEGLSLSEASSIIEIHSPDIHPVSDMTMTTNTIDLLSSLENTVAQAMTNAEPLRSSMTTIEWNHKDTYQQHVFSIDHPIESCWPQNKIDFYKQDIKDIQEVLKREKYIYIYNHI
ncbi:uncharacterized protein BX663DRAFT_505927 [Cokeromyces recurvatus]|uniref:uncharacterized protein n=1 Tax=Cokeromyces recurvatus TaxID=90255 RepID=UPI002220F5D1|nr:uncharacterized protein BX663DRAFT_505927 [Cokeromyces recurvatus]KAI7903963.1 hypothetical protein BX663DRAFT_505927 [Cokeromyces recurvatus]